MQGHHLTSCAISPPQMWTFSSQSTPLLLLKQRSVASASPEESMLSFAHPTVKFPTAEHSSLSLRAWSLEGDFNPNPRLNQGSELVHLDGLIETLGRTMLLPVTAFLFLSFFFSF